MHEQFTNKRNEIAFELDKVQIASNMFAYMRYLFFLHTPNAIQSIKKPEKNGE